MNKHIPFISGIIASAFLFTACSDDFIEVKNPTGEPLEEYYTNDGALNEALTSAYAPLHWPDWDNVAYNDLTVDAEIMGDDFWVGGASITDNQHWHKLFNFEADGNNTLATLWTDFYSGIKRCNDCIKYCSWGGGTEANRRSYEMQARLLRVYYYNILWHYYGNVPFYLENLSLPYTAPQLQADEIYNLLMPELEDIIASGVLPMKWPTSESGRVSQAMAMMLYAEMAMYQNDTARYPQALTFMKQIIADSNYKLHGDFAELWKESGEWCEESIFEINYNNNKRIYRYAETLLNAAELLILTGGNASEATGYVNEVRQRAGLAALSSVSIDDIIQERHLEFCGEGKRYFDLVRSGKAATTLVPDSYGYRTNSWTPSKKHIPLSQSELDADPTLVQNNY